MFPEYLAGKYYERFLYLAGIDFTKADAFLKHHGQRGVINITNPTYGRPEKTDIQGLVRPFGEFSRPFGPFRTPLCKLFHPFCKMETGRCLLLNPVRPPPPGPNSSESDTSKPGP